jgi:hypothetical protein
MQCIDISKSFNTFDNSAAFLAIPICQNVAHICKRDKLKIHSWFSATGFWG